MADDGSVEGLKKKLYSRTSEEEHAGRTPLAPSESHAAMSWGGQVPPAQRPAYTAQSAPSGGKFAKRFLLGSVVFFGLAALAATYFFFAGSNFISSQNITIETVVPSLIDGGSVAQLQFIITNRNSAALQLADLNIDYPAGTRDPKDPSKPLTHERQSIGAIAAGQQIKRTASAIFYGEEGAVQTISVGLDYSVANSNAVFVRETHTDLTIGSSPAAVTVEAPAETVAGQPFTVAVTVRNNSTAPLANLGLEAQYPFGFALTSATPKASVGALWRLGTLAPGEAKVIRLTGTLQGQDGDARVFRFLAGAGLDGTDSHVTVPFLTVPSTITVHRPFISGTIAVNGQAGSTATAQPGRPITGTINWQNNLSDPVQNVEVSVKLDGPAVDKATVSGGTGFYQSSSNTITWTANEDPSLATVGPGGQGTLQFSFSTLAPGSGGVLYSNPTVTLTLSVKGVRTGADGAQESVSAVDSTKITLASAVALSAQALHFTGAFSNPGTLPPRAEQKTYYTILWSVKNSSNTVAQSAVTTVLPSYTEFVTAQEGSGVTYDAGSRTVRWDMGDLKAGVGWSTAARTASFQVSILPSVSQISQAVNITGAAQLTGTDRFAQVQVSATAEAATTKLTEPGFVSGMEIVQPK